MENERAGSTWGEPEDLELLDEIRTGHTVADIARKHGRSPGAISHRIKKLLDMEDQGFISDQQLLELTLTLLSENESWPLKPTYKTKSIKPHRTGTPLGKRTQVSRILSLHNTLTGTRTTQADAEEFLTSSALDMLTEFDVDTLTGAAERLLESNRPLSPEHWSFECQYPGLTELDFTTAQLRDNQEDIRYDCIQLIEANLIKFNDDRMADIMRKRLGLTGEFMTLEAIGTQHDVTRERIRQLQKKALNQLSIRLVHTSDRSWHYVKKIFSTALSPPDGTKLAADLVLNFIDLVTPSASLDVAVQFIARSCGYTDTDTIDLVHQVKNLSKKHAEQLRQQLQQEKRQGKLSARLSPIITKAFWPERTITPSAGERLEPRRGPNASSELSQPGLWQSTKLGRNVGYDSKAELHVIQLLDMSDEITWYCEQPFEIPYKLYGQNFTYVPDLAVDLHDGRRLVLEVKGWATDMVDQKNVAKIWAAMHYCHRRGWGFTVTNGRISLKDLQSRMVRDSAASVIRRHLAVRPIDLRSARALQEEHGITPEDMAAMVWQNRWYFRKYPYRVSRTPLPEHLDPPQTQ